ncbi:MAG: hypothetical protein GY797_34585 [Deltaproteobacteria bacterium]|nr:hypothetical protein [Deltaproteobacteria bacterium]
MNWLAEAFTENSIVWLLLSTFVALLSGFVSSWLTYRFVKRREMIESIELEEESEKQERIRQEVIRWANPILAAVKDLEGRLRNILDLAGYLALSENYENQVNSDWSISYDYFMNSTLYLFGLYFAWTRMLQEELNFELFESQRDKDRFFQAIAKVAKSLGSFPPKYSCSGKDTQVFRLQQQAIGELFIVDGHKHRRCLNYPEFLQKLNDNQFSQHLRPLRALLEDVSPESDCRWKRLEVTKQALADLEAHCKDLLVLSEET